ncbi:MAG TPA: YdcF family protein [Pseudolabrys sp.]|nr:YdcF family protein [Pseudolabrys sp.]
MFFILSKTAALLLVPSNLIALIGLAGLLLMATRLRRIGLRCLAASVVLLIVVGLFPFGAVLSHVLESRFPPWDPTRGAPDGIIVLGGAISPELSRDYGTTIVGSDAGRIIAVAKLARAYPSARFIYSGGDASLLADQPDEARYLYPLLDDFGIARARVTLEARSRNTAENAVFSKELAKPQPGERWLLVTSAQHMPRAVGCFRRVGFGVEAYPVAWHTGKDFDLTPRLYIGGNIVQFDTAVHEWIGIIVYWASGRTFTFLPSP